MYEYKERGKLLVNVFSNISELYKYCKNTPRRVGAKNCSETEGSDFSYTRSLQESYDLLIQGDDNLYKKFKEKNKVNITKMLGNVLNKNKIKNNIVGFQANVPNYLLGLPDNMLYTEPKKTSQKVLNLMIICTVSAFTGIDEMIEIGTIYMQVIDLLEKGGYRCNLYIGDASQCSGEKTYCLTKIKTDREPFNIKKNIFTIMNPGFFRRILFKWCESCNSEVEFTQDGYGRPITSDETIKSDLDKTLKGNFMIWTFQKNSNEVTIEKVLEDLEKKYGIKLGD